MERAWPAGKQGRSQPTSLVFETNNRCSPGNKYWKKTTISTVEITVSIIAMALKK